MASRTKPALRVQALFALMLLTIAMLAVFGMVPQPVAQYSVIAVPALAASVLVRSPACCGAQS
jgi:hypothetical protein